MNQALDSDNACRARVREGLRYAIEEMTEPRLMVWNRRS